jgi:hypothetical protein
MKFLNPSYVIMAVGNISIKFASVWVWHGDWGSYELEMTRMHAFQRDNDSMVIVVLKDDISMERIPHVLQSMWFKITCVKWPYRVMHENT